MQTNTVQSHPIPYFFLSRFATENASTTGSSLFRRLTRSCSELSIDMRAKSVMWSNTSSKSALLMKTERRVSPYVSCAVHSAKRSRSGIKKINKIDVKTKRRPYSKETHSILKICGRFFTIIIMKYC